MFDTANPPQARIAPADSKPRTRFSLKTKTQRHADAAPLPVSSVATTGVRSSARPAQRMGDVCRQVSWLAAQTLPPAFPTLAKLAASVASQVEARRLQLRGQPRNCDCRSEEQLARTGFPFSLDMAFTAPEPSRSPCAQISLPPSSAARLPPASRQQASHFCFVGNVLTSATGLATGAHVRAGGCSWASTRAR